MSKSRFKLTAICSLLIFTLITALPVYAKGSSGSGGSTKTSTTRSTSLSGGFGSRSDSKPATQQKTSFGGFSGQSKPTQAPLNAPAVQNSQTAPKTNSALAADLSKSNAQKNAIDTLNARKAAVVGVGAVAAGSAISGSSTDQQKAYSDNARVANAPTNGNSNVSEYYRQQSQQPQTVVINNNSGGGLSHAVAGYMVGQAVANAEHRHSGDDYKRDSRPVSLNQSDSGTQTTSPNDQVAPYEAPAAAKVATPKKNETEESHWFGWFLALAVIAAGSFMLIRHLSAPQDTKSYSLGR